MSERFYINCPLRPGPIQLEGAEAHHLGIVCRLHPGDEVYLFNGDGHQYPARVTAVARKYIGLEVCGVETIQTELPFTLELAAPLPRGDRAQFLVEKLTELGVTTFVPLCTKRSVLHPGEGKLEKLQRHVIEASKQCGRNTLLRIEPAIPWREYVEKNTQMKSRIVAHVGQAKRSGFAQVDTAIAVGPEGGFAEEEVDLAKQLGWEVTGLGPRILRVETAAVVLAAWATQY